MNEWVIHMAYHTQKNLLVLYGMELLGQCGTDRLLRSARYRM
jgi:hypothetical protein